MRLIAHSGRPRRRRGRQATSGAASWTYGINVSAFPADGSYVIRARPTDNVGNPGFASVEMTLDNDPPSVPQITRKLPNPSGNSAVFEFDIAEAGLDAVQAGYRRLVGLQLATHIQRTRRR